MSLLDRLRRARTGGPAPIESPAPEGSTPDPPAPSRPAAVVVEHYDVRAIAVQLRDTVTSILDEAGIEYAVLPEGTSDLPTVIVPAGAGGTMLAALRGAGESATWRVIATPRRGEPAPAEPIGNLTGTRGLLSLTLLPTLASPTGIPVDEPLAAVELQLWRRVREPHAARRDGGDFEVGTLLAARRNRLVDYLEPVSWQRAQQSPQRWARPFLPHVFDVAEPVDLVYTWVDGNDPEWLSRKAAAQGTIRPASGHNPDAFAGARFADHDELRYSLRSVQAHASWANHVWLVTDGQVPAWLNTAHPGLTVVDHHDIFTDPSVLPVFNSHAIESQLHHIAGLSERYLYLNDDVFFGRPVRAEAFFHGNGIAKLFPSSALLDAEDLTDRDVPVQAAAKQTRAIIEAEFGRTFSQKTQHVPLPQLRSVLHELENRFPERFAEVMASRFRHPNDLAVPSSLAQYWAYATGRAVVGSLQYGYLDLSAGTTPDKLADWLERRPFECFCINDSETDPSTAAERDRAVREFLRTYFPMPSDYES